MAVSFAAAPDCFSSAQGDPKKGQNIFETLTCVDCHKGGGNSVHPSRPLKGESFLKRYPKDSKIEKLIRSGVAGASMPSFGTDVINEGDMKDLIAYIRSLTPANCSDDNNKAKSIKGKTGKGKS
ncbi:MAG: cytochrome c [Candidatus Obscuribacterales bacterium]|nr:cytochrome c [Candidatus Obscuribacterales bacterium]